MRGPEDAARGVCWVRDLASGEQSEQPLPGSDPEDVGTPFGGAVRSRWFVLVTAALSLGMLSQLGLLAHLYHAVETRIDAPTAAWALSLTAASSLVGRLVASWALTRLRLSTATVWLLVTQGTAIAVLAVADRRYRRRRAAAADRESMRPAREVRA